MITIFSIPKGFGGHATVIQRNAIRSWKLLHPANEIILFGDDEGTHETAAEFGLRHVSEVARSQQKTPLVDDIFEQAQSLATYNILCYVNADIILMSDFIRAIKQVSTHQQDRFLLIGQRWNLDVAESLEFEAGWEEQLRSSVTKHGELYTIAGIDYFVFSRNIFEKIPPFAIGRTTWDNWLIYSARRQGIPVIDATPVVMAVHQNHDYSHIQGGESEAYKGQEAMLNRKLGGNYAYLFDMHDATHILTQDGVVPAIEDVYLKQRVKRQVLLDLDSSMKGSFIKRLLILGMRACLKYLPHKIWRKLFYQWVEPIEQNRVASGKDER